MKYNCIFKLPNGEELIMKNMGKPKLRIKLSKLMHDNYYWRKKITTTMFHNLKKKLYDPTSTRGVHPILLSVIQLEQQQ